MSQENRKKFKRGKDGAINLGLELLSHLDPEISEKQRLLGFHGTIGWILNDGRVYCARDVRIRDPEQDIVDIDKYGIWKLALSRDTSILFFCNWMEGPVKRKFQFWEIDPPSLITRGHDQVVDLIVVRNFVLSKCGRQVYNDNGSEHGSG
jgi:hypothetical protein